MAPSLDIAAQRDPRSARPPAGQRSRARKPWSTDRAGRARTLTMLQSTAGNAAVTRLLTKGAPTGYGGLGGKRDMVEAPPATPTAATGQREGATDGQALIDEQREAVTVDAQESEARIGEATTDGEGRIGEHFGGVREGLATLLSRSEVDVGGFITAKRAEAEAASAQATAAAQSTVDGTVTAAQAQGEQARQTITTAVDGVSSSLDGTVQGITGQITGVVNRISLPDVPGVGRLRSLAAGLVNRAAGAVTGGLGQVRTLLSTALQTGTRMVGSLITQIGRAASSALSRSGAAIKRGVQTVASGLGRVSTLVLGAVRRVVSATVLPAVNRLEGRLVQNLGTARRQAVTAVRANRDGHLRTLAATSKDTAVTETGAAALRSMTAEAREGNRSMIETYRERSGGILGSVFQALTTGAAQITTQIGGLLGQARNAVLGTVGQIVAGFGQITTAVSDFAGSLLQSLSTAVTDVVGSVQGLIQDPARSLTDFGRGALTAVTDLPARLARNVLSGDFTLPSLDQVTGHFRPTSGGPITKPRPGPITLPGLGTLLLILAAVGAIVVYAFPQLMTVVAALVALGLTPAGALIVVGIAAILILIALLLLLYLLWKLLTSKPANPDPDPVITHETTFSAPDGSPKSRGEVGVGEEVVFTGTPSGTWAATAGTPATGTGPKFTWTAPERATTATITLTAGSKSKSVDVKVVEPASIVAHRNSTIPIGVGRAGAGMKLTFHYHPKHVSFGNAEAMEVSGPATNVTGFFLKNFTPTELWHDSGDTFFPIKENNEDSAEDTASLSTGKTPWEAGTFDWVIPNHFKVKTESGNGKKFTEVTQAFQMLDATGRVRIDKAGASVERSPSDP